MSDPTLDHIDHGVEGWDTIFNDNMDKLTNNFMRKTKAADHGETTYVEHIEGVSPALSGATYTFTGIIPAGCVLLAVSSRVTTLVTGATSIDIGDGTTADQFAHHTSVALATVTGLANHAASAVPKLYLAAGDIKLTAVGSNFTAGVVRVVAHVLKITSPTS